MKDFGASARAAIEAGAAISVGAVRIDTLPDPVLVWGGFGDLELEGDTFVGVGHYGMVQASQGALGGGEQTVNLELSGVDPEAIALFDKAALRRVPVTVWRLIFDSLGKTLLAAPVFTRGRLDQLPVEETPGGTSTIRAMVEGAARGLGRTGGRIASDADQRLVDPDDDGLKGVSYSGELAIYWGGKLPMTVRQLTAQDVVSQTLDRII